MLRVETLVIGKSGWTGLQNLGHQSLDCKPNNCTSNRKLFCGRYPECQMG